VYVILALLQISVLTGPFWRSRNPNVKRSVHKAFQLLTIVHIKHVYMKILNILLIFV